MNATRNLASFPPAPTERGWTARLAASAAATYRFIFGNSPEPAFIGSEGARDSPTLGQFSPELFQPPPSSLESLATAMTEATSRFVNKRVRVLWLEDPTSRFQVEAVCFHVGTAARSMMKDFIELPATPKLRFVTGRMSRASGAKEMLVLDQLASVFIAPKDSPNEEYALRTLLICEGAEVELKIEFIGNYINVEPAPVPEVGTTHVDDTFVPSPGTPLAKSIDRWDDAAASSVTPLAAVRVRAPAPILLATIRETGGDETHFEIFERDLPAVIGRRVCNASSGLAADTFVSDCHLVIAKFLQHRGLLTIENRGRNGTWDRREKKPSSFGYLCSDDEWLSLGGEFNTPRTAQVKFKTP